MTEIDQTHYVVYRVMMPILVALGIAANGLCLVVLSRPSLMSKRVNGYFLVLAIADLMVCLCHVPVITTVTGCIFSSYSEAVFFTRFGWTLVGVFQSFGTYTIVWLSFDRFVAVWMYDIYPRIQQKPHVRRNRLLLTAVSCIIFHLAYMVNAEVVCSTATQVDEECTEGEWIGVSGYQYQFDHTWHKVFSVFYGLFMRWVPSCLLAVFNVGLVLGLVKGKVNFPGANQQGQRTVVITTIAITLSYTLLTLPIIVYITGFASHVSERCSKMYPKETLRAVGNILQLVEHVIHIVFLLGLNHRFRKELKILLRLEKSTGGGNDEEVAEGAQEGQMEEPRRLQVPRRARTQSISPAKLTNISEGQ